MAEANAAASAHVLANGKTRIDFQTEPARYRHWKLKIDGDVATLIDGRRREGRRCSKATS